MDELIGQRIGKRTIVAVHEIGRLVTLLCDCGNKTEVPYKSAKKTKQCKTCRNRYLSKKYCTSHGHADTKVYYAWQHMKNRTTNPKAANYSYYGGRGIKVCQRWLDSFEAFYEDMGQPPSDGHTLERVDVNGDYCKENCKWATKKEQTRNRRTTAMFFGKPIAEWSEELYIPYNYVAHRLRRGDSIQLIQEEWSTGNKKANLGRIYVDGVLLTDWVKTSGIPYGFCKTRARKGMTGKEIQEAYKFYKPRNKQTKI